MASNEPELEDNELKPECEKSEVKQERDMNQVEAEPDQTFAKQQLTRLNQSQSSLLDLTWNKQEDEISVVIPKMEICNEERTLAKSCENISPTWTSFACHSQREAYLP